MKWRDVATLAVLCDCDPETDAIKYLVSDSVEEKGKIVKKPSVNVWSVCDELGIMHEESRSSTNLI